MYAIRRIGPVLALVCLLSLPLAAEPSTEKGSGSADEPVNILVTIKLGTVDEADGTSTKSYQLITRGGQRAELMNGQRVPIATTFQGEKAGGQGVPITSYTYQNVGFSAQVWAHLHGRGKIRIDAEIEDSRLPTGNKSAQPVIIASHHAINAVLSEGVPLRIVRHEPSRTKPLYVELEAEILD